MFDEYYEEMLNAPACPAQAGHVAELTEEELEEIERRADLWLMDCAGIL